jgi:predicted transcriptional regulator
LNQKAAAVIVLTILTVSLCFTVVATASDRPIFFSDFQNINNLHEISFSVPIVVGASLHSNPSQPIEQPTRLEIYDYIKSNAGVHFRGICEGLGLSVGVVQYHLNVLEHAGKITAYTDGQNKRYFEYGAFTTTDTQLISLMRHGTAAKILTILAQNSSILHKNLATNLGISSQALTWQMNQLKETGLINAEKTSVNVKYSFTDANIQKQIISLNEQFKI